MAAVVSGGPMYTDFADTLWQLLCTDEEAAARVLQPLGAERAVVELIEADLTVDEALAYARGLHELGMDAQAHELLEAILQSLLAMGPQGPQVAAEPVPMGSQGICWS